MSCFSRKVVRYGDKVVKSGPGILPSEAETMRFIAANTSIPVPRVYKEERGLEPSITMDYIEGETLHAVWNGLPEEQKLDIEEQLKGILSQLRSLKGQYIGSINRGEADDVRKFHYTGGPFDTEAEFNRFLVSDKLKGCLSILYDMAFRSLRTDHEIVFTHGNFAPRNIIVKDGRVVALLDWEFSGWYPEYWEFVKALKGADHRCTWYNYVEAIFPVCHETEYIKDQFLGAILRY
jgi:aminoglycoside phosphotransferase (APT) family kinase protein